MKIVDHEMETVDGDKEHSDKDEDPEPETNDLKQKTVTAKKVKQKINSTNKPECKTCGETFHKNSIRRHERMCEVRFLVATNSTSPPPLKKPRLVKPLISPKLTRSRRKGGS